ncbi:MAG: hypothetical protein NTV34_17515, partial [Proteobacteria bacterium]|nr:hypothetical protein [Pseudomonadota bacterium]
STSTPYGKEGQSPPITGEQEAAEYYRALIAYIGILVKYFGDTEYALQKARFFTATGSRWFLFGHSFWRVTMKAKNLVEMKNAVEIYAHLHANTMYQRIEL